MGLLSLAAAVTAAVVTPPTVTVLPGKPIAVTAPQRAAGAVAVHRMLVTGAGARRVSLLVGRTADRRLCVGSRSFFRCLAEVDAQPAYVMSAFGRISGKPEPVWGAIVGLAGPEIERVDVQLQQGERHTLRLRRFRGFLWRAFAFPPTGPNGRLPYVVFLKGRQGPREIWLDMAPHAPTSDSPYAPIGETRPRMAAAKRLALADPRVRWLLAPVTSVVAAPGPWTGCGGKPIGAIVTFQLFRPISIDRDLPFVRFGPATRGRAYAEGVMHLRADGVTSLDVGVDLDRRTVISIDPGGDSIRAHGFRIVRKPTPAGRPAPGRCAEEKD
jgi:hypothetical protein